MHDEPRAAARAPGLPAAGRAQQRRREAAAVDEDERLLAAREPRRDRGEQRRADAFDARRDRDAARSTTDGRRAAATARAGSTSRSIAAALRLHGATRATASRVPSTTGTPRCARAPDRDVAPVVAHAVLLLERRVVLLVDDDERRAAAAARTPRAACRARGRPRRPPPRASARRRCAGRKPLCSGDRAPARQRAARCAAASCGVRLISGTSSSAWPPAAMHARGGCEIDLGLAAAGDAVEQERREASVRAADRRDRALLLVVERHRARGGDRPAPAHASSTQPASRQRRSHARSAPATPRFRRRQHPLRRRQPLLEQLARPRRAAERCRERGAPVVGQALRERRCARRRACADARPSGGTICASTRPSGSW